LLLLLCIEGFFSLLPDIPAVWNYFLFGNLNHGMAGPVPTHSVLFCSLAFFGAAFLGQLLYRHRGKAVALGILAEATTLFHLLLDDLDDGVITYLYPVYNQPFSLFTFLFTRPINVGVLHYTFAVVVGVFLFVFVLVMAYTSLKYLGFGSKYEPFKQNN
jgi:inner membrane protein